MADDYVAQIERSQALVRQARELMQRSREDRTKLDQVWEDRPQDPGRNPDAGPR